MQLWKTHARRIAALVCTLAMTACLLPSAAFATGAEPAAQPGATQSEPADTTEVTTEEKTKVETEVNTEVETEANTEVKTEANTEENTEEKTEVETEESTEANTEEKTEVETEESTEVKTEESTEAKTEENTETNTEDKTEESTADETEPDSVPAEITLNSLTAATTKEGKTGPDTNEVFFYILKPSLATGLTGNVEDYYFLVKGGKASEDAKTFAFGQAEQDTSEEANITKYVGSWPTDKKPGEGWVAGTSEYVGNGSTWKINENGEVEEFSLKLGDETYDSTYYEIRWSKFSRVQTVDKEGYQDTYHMDGILYKKTLVEDAVNKIQPKKVGLMFPLTDDGKQGRGPATFTFTLSRLPGEGEEATDENDFAPVKMTATVNSLGEAAAITLADENDAKQKLLPGNYKIEEDLEGKNADIWAVPDTITFTVSTDGTITRTSSDAVIKNKLAQYGLYYDKNLGTDTSADASNMPDNQTSAIYYNSMVTVSDTVPMRAGYWFKGWNTQPDGSGMPYKGGQQTQIKGNVTLYAQWEPMYKFTLQPANMTIYVGGSGDAYGGIVDENGTVASNANSLPEPGFYFTFGDDLNTALNEALGLENSTTAVDLSKYVTVTAQTTDNQTRSWKLTRYGSEGETASSTAVVGDDSIERFVYKIDPPEKQDPIRVQIKKGDTVVTSDSFEPSEALYAEYDVSLYTGGVDPNTIMMEIKVDGSDSTDGQEHIFRCQYDAEGSALGKLTVRHASKDAPTTTAAVGEDALAEKIERDPRNFHVQIDDQQNVYLNETNDGTDEGGITVAHEDVSLLADTLVGGDNYEFMLALYEKAQTEAGFARANVDSAYLDLVDASNGNAWLTAEGKVKVFWPYRNGMNQNSTLKLYHFEGLDRNMTTEDLPGQIELTEAAPVPFTQDEHGITFETDSFSPFVLVCDTTPAPQPSTGGGSSDKGSSQSSTVTVTATAPTPTPAPAAKPAAAATVIPQTGDDMPVGLLAGLAVVAAGGLAALLVLRKRRGDR